MASSMTMSLQSGLTRGSIKPSRSVIARATLADPEPVTYKFDISGGKVTGAQVISASKTILHLTDSGAPVSAVPAFQLWAPTPKPVVSAAKPVAPTLVASVVVAAPSAPKPVAPMASASNAAPSASTQVVASSKQDSGFKVASFKEVMSFSGTGPEIVNGRLAMAGFVAAVAAELAGGERYTVMYQLLSHPARVGMVFLPIIVISLVPIFMKAKDEAGPFTNSAELLNGRAAMLGFAALLIMERMSGSAFF